MVLVTIYRQSSTEIYKDKVMVEIWRDIEDWVCTYQVSNLGNVRSLPRVDTSGRNRRGVMLTPRLDLNGYGTVALSKGGFKPKNMKIHRLVAMAFIANPDNKRTVNHLNGVKLDNRVENLAWATHSEQMYHCHETGLTKPPLGSQKCNALLNDDKVRAIRVLRKENHPVKSIAAKYGVSERAVRHVLLGTSWKHVI